MVKALLFFKQCVCVGIFFVLPLDSNLVFAQAPPTLGAGKFAYGYYQGGSDYSNVQWSQLTHVIDFSFALDPVANGTLDDNHQASFVLTAEQNGVRPIMGVNYVSNNAVSVLHSVLSGVNEQNLKAEFNQ